MAYTRTILRDTKPIVVRDHINRESAKVVTETARLEDVKLDTADLNGLIDTKLGTGVSTTIIPTFSNTYNLGSTTKKFTDLFLVSTINLGSNTISASGTTLTVSNNLDITGNLTITGTTTFNGPTIVLGDNASDSINFNANINSSVIPAVNNTYNLGSTTRTWNTLHATTLNATTLNATGSTQTLGTIQVSGNTITSTNSNTVTVNDNLTATGTITGNVTGNVTGNLTGNVTGNITGNVVSNSVIIDNLNIKAYATAIAVALG
jgi:hypothetical protein